MTKTIHIRVEEGQFNDLRELKRDHGLTWKGMLLRGAETLEGEDDAQD